MKKTISLLLAAGLACAGLCGCRDKRDEERLNLFCQADAVVQDGVPMVYGAKFFKVPQAFLGNNLRILKVTAGKVEVAFERKLEDKGSSGDFFIATFFTTYRGSQSVEVIFRQGPTNQEPVFQFHCPDKHMLNKYGLSRSRGVTIPMVVDVMGMCPIDKESEYRDVPLSDEEDLLSFSRAHPEGVFYIMKIEEGSGKTSHATH